MEKNGMDLEFGGEEEIKTSAEAKHLHFDRGTPAYNLCATFGTGKKSLTVKLVNGLSRRLQKEGFVAASNRATKRGSASLCLVTWDPDAGDWEGLPDVPEPVVTEVPDASAE